MILRARVGGDLGHSACFANPVPDSAQEKNVEVARLLDEIGDLLDLEGGNPFHVRAYKLAARNVRKLERGVEDLLDEGESPAELPLLHDEIGRTVRDLSRSGTSPRLYELLGRLPRGVRELAGVPGLDPKRAVALRHALGLRSLDDLESAARAGRIHEVRGFGEKSERAILDALEQRASESKRFRLDVAHRRAVELRAWLEGSGKASHVSAAGELRRQVPTVSGVELVATSLDPLAALAHLFSHPDVSETISRSRTRGAVRLKTGLRVELHLVKPEGRGAALLHLTGSKAHIEHLRRRADERGVELNTFGVFDREGRRLAGATEEDVYAALALGWIAPELREGHDEVMRAANGTLPTLVEATNICGDLHMLADPLDTTGTSALLEEAARLGLRYVVVVVPSADNLVGFDEERFQQRLRALTTLASSSRVHILSGVEAEIEESGGLNLPDSALDAVDVVLLACRTRFDLPRAVQTDRIVHAMAHPRAMILAHPRGRLLGRSEGMSLDLERVFQEAKRRGVAVEINAQPDRLDLDGDACRLAKALGVAVAIGSGASTPEEISWLDLGVGQARRGGLTSADVWNVKSAAELPSSHRSA